MLSNLDFGIILDDMECKKQCLKRPLKCLEDVLTLVILPYFVGVLKVKATKQRQVQFGRRGGDLMVGVLAFILNDLRSKPDRS